MTDSRYRMADVGGKAVTRRRAVATGRIRVGAEVFARLEDGTLPKGDPLSLAEVAGIMAAKRTPDLLPLCHPLTLDHVVVICRPDPADQTVEAFAAVVTSARTGVEMEALTAVNAALLAIWDLAKPIEPALAIDGVRLLLKEGGKSGRWEHPDGLPPLPPEISNTPDP